MTDTEHATLTELYAWTRDGDLLDPEFHEKVTNTTLRRLCRQKLAHHEGDGLYRITLRGIAVIRGAKVEPKRITSGLSQHDIYKALQANPGVSINELADILGYKRPSITKHVRHMYYDQIITRKRSDAAKHEYIYYAGSDENAPPPTQPKPHKRNKGDDILDHLAKQGPQTQQQISETLGINRNTVGTHIRRLTRKGLINHVGSIRITSGQTQRLYEHAEHPASKEQLQKLLANNLNEVIHAWIVNNPHCNQREIARGLDLPYSVVNRTIAKLRLGKRVDERRGYRDNRPVYTYTAA